LTTCPARFPGAMRKRRTAPGAAFWKPAGAVYQGSLDGGMGAVAVAVAEEAASRAARAMKMRATRAMMRRGINEDAGRSDDAGGKGGFFSFPYYCCIYGVNAPS
jgi:hypothetical protein